MISFFVHFIIKLGIMLSSFYVFMKSIQYTATMSRKILTVVWCLLWAVLYAVGPSLIPTSLVRPLSCSVSIVFVFFLAKLNFETVVSAYLLSFGISLFLYYISGLLVSIVSALFMSSDIVADALLDYSQPIYLLIYSLIAILQLVLSFLIFRIRRFRKGFPFIFKKFTIIVSLFFTGIILIFVTWINMLAKNENARTTEETITVTSYIFGILIAGIGIYILIRRLIKAYQRMRSQQNTDNYYKKLWLDEKEDNKRLLEENKALHSINHNFADRITSMENNASGKGNVSLEDVQKLKKDYQIKLANVKNKELLQSTNNATIDNLFEYFADQFAADNIDFKVIVNGSIPYMVDNAIKQGDLETLIVNHLKDAQIAVNASDNPFRSITAVIGVPEGCYLFTIFDSGIPFEVDTLVRIGTERVTTHADTGGSGIGFETTFEIMREYNASLIINEQEQSTDDFSKSVSIRFDGKMQYIIETYRPGDFPASKRYIIV